MWCRQRILFHGRSARPRYFSSSVSRAMFSCWEIWRQFPIPTRPELVRRGVVLRAIGSRVEHLEASIGRGGQLGIVGGIMRSRAVGAEGLREGVRWAASFIKMQLPPILEARRGL